MRRMVQMLVVLLMMVFAQWGSSCLAAINVVEESGVEATMAKNVRTVVASFDALLAEKMKVSLNHDVKVFIAPNQNAYAAVLQRELGQSRDEAERNSKVSGGYSNARYQAVALNGDSNAMKSIGTVATLVVHELFHQIQGQLEGERRSRLYWMSEGSADYVGACIAEKLGVVNIENWKQQRINQLRKLSNHASPQELAYLSTSQWTTLMEAKKGPYEVSDLMLLFVLERTGKGLESVAEYFRLSGKLMDGDKALLGAFGVEPDMMKAKFLPWLTSQLAKTGDVDVEPIGSVSDAWLKATRSGVDQTVGIITEKWGISLASSFRMYVVASSDEYVRALTKELGISPDIAATRKNESWRYSRGIAIIQAAAISTDAQRARIGGQTVARMWMDDYIPRKSAEPLIWLRQGGALSVAFYKEQRESWKKQIVGDKPALSEIGTQAGLTDAEKRFGILKVEAMCGMAVSFLMETYGVEKLGEWLAKTKDQGDPASTFLSVYGKTHQEYEKDFAFWLKSI